MLKLKNESMKPWFLMLAAGLLFTACDKDNDKQAADALCLDGTIEWGGDPRADGRGWIFIPTEGTQAYYLKELPEAYKQDHLPVAVCLQQTGEKASCFCQPLPDLYKVLSIKRK